MSVFILIKERKGEGVPLCVANYFWHNVEFKVNLVRETNVHRSVLRRECIYKVHFSFKDYGKNDQTVRFCCAATDISLASTALRHRLQACYKTDPVCKT